MKPTFHFITLQNLCAEHGVPASLPEQGWIVVYDQSLKVASEKQWQKALQTLTLQTIPPFFLPHGRVTETGHVTTHPETVHPWWMLQRFAFGGIIAVQANLFREALATLNEQHTRDPQSLLYSLTLTLIHQHPQLNTSAPACVLYTSSRDTENTFANMALADIGPAWHITQAVLQEQQLLFSPVGTVCPQAVPMPESGKVTASILIPFRDQPALLEKLVAQMMVFKVHFPRTRNPSID
jgi:hypothetical protein